MKVYSPSATLSFQQCPQRWLWERQGWRPKAVGRPTVAASIGIGISKGMELLFKSSTVGAAVDGAIEIAYKEVNERIEAGGYLAPDAEKGLEEMPRRIEKAIKGFVKQRPFPEDWHTFVTEVTFPDHGHSRPDLLCQSDLGPCIVDYKSKVTAQDYIIDRFLQDMEKSWQMYHYIWAARAMGLQVESFAVCLIIIEPLHFYLEQWVVDEEHMARWVLDAHRWWAQMEKIDQDGLTPARVGEHRNQYGLCPQYGMCFDTPEVASTNYYKRERHETPQLISN